MGYWGAGRFPGSVAPWGRTADATYMGRTAQSSAIGLEKPVRGRTAQQRGRHPGQAPENQRRAAARNQQKARS